MLPYCLFLLFRAYIPLLWVDMPLPQKHTHTHTLHRLAVLQFLFWQILSCQTAVNKFFCAGVITFKRFLCRHWSKPICVMTFGVVRANLWPLFLWFQYSMQNVIVLFESLCLFDLFFFLSLKVLSTLSKWRCMVLEWFKAFWINFSFYTTSNTFFLTVKWSNEVLSFFFFFEWWGSVRLFGKWIYLCLLR